MARTVFSDGNTPVTSVELNGWQNHVHDGVDDNGHAEKIDLELHTTLDFNTQEVNDQRKARAWAVVKLLSTATPSLDCNTAQTGALNVTKLATGSYKGEFDAGTWPPNGLIASSVPGIGCTASVDASVPTMHSVTATKIAGNKVEWTMKVWDSSGTPYDPTHITVTAFWEHIR